MVLSLEQPAERTAQLASSIASLEARRFLQSTKDILSTQEMIYHILSRTTTYKDGAAYIEGFFGPVDCIRYGHSGVEFVPGGRHIGPPAPGEVTVLATALSLCGTDRGFLKMMQDGTLPQDVAAAKAAGHEMAGIVIGTGRGVDHCDIGDLVNPDSHVPCGVGNHLNLDACVGSGRGCDGIVSVRGSLNADGIRMPVPPGYFSPVVNLNAKSIVRCIPDEIAREIASPSVFESLGNSREVLLILAEMGLSNRLGHTMLIVSGLGATGYPLTAFATHNELRVVGIDPAPSQRQLADENNTCEATFATTQEAENYAIPQVETASIHNVVVAIMSGHPQALKDGIDLLRGTGFSSNNRRVLVVFGLFNDPSAPMPFIPQDFGLTQRDFVFNRRNYKTDDGIEIVGVCGRSRQTWFDMMDDFSPHQPGGLPLIHKINKGIELLPGPDPFRTLFNILTGKEAGIQRALAVGGNKVKLAANFYQFD
ncbi:alcohol dehydrogenase catalytic domain-containing protein [Candidatus Gottesmanbacteria bacterium]|nr:alcohol dehydrogenase catalytic domain-containing protein [Candidatus Gottesmanbacteria bacterium]